MLIYLEPDKPWACFPIQLHQSARAFFSVVVVFEVGDGRNTIVLD
jgi:hypothetical protein